MKIAELFAEIGFKVDDGGLFQLDNVMKSTLKDVTFLIAKVVAATYAVKKFADASISMAAAIKSFRVETGLSTVELQKWQSAVMQTDIEATADSVANSIKSLQSNLAQIRLGQGDVGAFQLLGVNPYGNAFQVLEQLRKTLKGIDQATAINLLQRMGLGPEIYHALRLTNDEFEKLGSNFILTVEQTEKLTKAGTAFERFGQNIKYTFAKMNAELSPFYEFVSNFLSRAFDALANSIEYLWYVGENLVRTFDYWTSRIPFLKELIITLTALGLAFALANPVTQTALAVGALILVFDDLMTMIKGGHSLFGDMFERAIELVKKLGELIREYIIDPLTNFNPVSLLVGGAQAAANTFTNVFHITSDNPDAVASAVVGTMQNQMNFSAADVNNSGF